MPLRVFSRSKYGNRKTEVDGITFDSAKEARRWSELRLLERAGQINALQRQVAYPLIVNGKKICTYVCDFEYMDRLGNQIVEDVKSPATRGEPVYRLKKKLMLACRGIEVVEA